jgi:two-component system chemotaxis response regulator CheY
MVPGQPRHLICILKNPTAMSEGDTRVLVAEDAVSTALVLRFILKRLGLNVTVARDGQTAWEEAQAQSFDLVIADQQMPGMTGAELLARLRKIPAYANTPFVMATAKAIELDLPQLKKQLQLAAVFGKPFSPNRLGALVESLIPLRT